MFDDRETTLGSDARRLRPMASRMYASRKYAARCVAFLVSRSRLLLCVLCWTTTAVKSSLDYDLVRSCDCYSI